MVVMRAVVRAVETGTALLGEAQRWLLQM